MITAIYAGSFDPISAGHLDIINRSMRFCDKLIIAIGVNSGKTTFFSVEERVAQINSCAPKNVSTAYFQGLMVEFAKKEGASILIRGIRSVSDFEYEINLASVNKILAPEIETIFLPTSPELAVVSSSMIKEIAKHGGDISRFLPIHLAEQVKAKFGFFKTGEKAKDYTLNSNDMILNSNHKK